MIPPLLFEISPEMQARMVAGTARRVGALILDTNTGRILQHVQQTGLAGQVLNGLGQAANLASGGGLNTAASLVSAVTTYRQNAAILRGLDLLRGLQIADLALGGVTLGIGLIGHAMTVARIDRLTRSVAALQDQVARIEGKVDQILDQPFHEALTALKAQGMRVDDAWSTARPEAEWHAALEPIYVLQTTFQTRAASDLGAGAIDRAEVALEAMALAGGLLVAIRTAMNDLGAAAGAAARLSSDLSRLSSPIGPAQLRPAFRPDQSPAERLHLIETSRSRIILRLAGFREREERLAQAAPILQSLARQGVQGRAWLERLRSETQSPFALVDHSTTG